MTRAATRLRSPLARMLLIRALLDVQFWFPTWLIFLLGQGFTLAEATAADAIFHAVIVLAEVPMGWVCDRIGRRRSLIAVCISTTAVFLAIGFSTGFLMLIAAWTLWGVLWALGSGLDTAYAWELAETYGEGTTPQRYLGRVRIVSAVIGVGSLVLAGPLLEIWPPLPYVTTAALACIALVLTMTLPPDSTPTARVGSHRLPTFAETMGRPIVRAGLVLSASILVVGISPRILFQPLGLELGLSSSFISGAYGIFAVCVGLGAWTAGRAPARSLGRWTTIAIGLCGVAFFAIGALSPVAPGWAVMTLVLPIGGLSFGLAKTLSDIWLASQVRPAFRARILSLGSAASGILMVPIRPVLVATSTGAGMSWTFMGWGAVCIGIAAMCALVIHRVAAH